MPRWCLACAVATALAAPARAEGVALPYAPQQSGGEDSIDTAEGTRCRQSLNNSGPMLDVGLGSNFGMTGMRPRREDSGELVAYARIVIPLGRQPDRLDCKRLYDLEIERLQMEIELLRMGAN